MQSVGSARNVSINALMLTIGTLVRMGGSFVFVIYVAARLGLEGFGQYSLAVFYLELFAALAGTAAGIMLVRDSSRWSARFNHLMTASTATVTILAILFTAFMCGLPLLFGYQQETREVLWITALAIVPGAICVLCESAFVAIHRAEFVVVGNTFEFCLRIGGSLAALLNGGGLWELAVVLVITRLLQLVLFLGVLITLQGYRVRWSNGQLLRFISRWRIFAAENWMATIYHSLDTIMLSALVGEAAVGLYTAAWKVVRLGSIVAKSYTSAVFPVMSRMYGQANDQLSVLCRESIRVMCLLAIPCSVGVMVLSDQIIELLYDPEYAAAATILQVLVWVLVIEFLNPFLSHALFARGEQNRSLQVAGISLVVNVALTWLLVSRYEGVGAAIGTLVSGGIATMMYMFFLMPATEIRKVSSTIIRIFLAATGIGVCLSTVNLVWLPIGLLLSLTSYLILLYILQAVTRDDFRLLSRLMRYSS